jgi:hypothetical protein
MKESSSGPSVTEKDMLFAAMREARRHYVYCNRDFDKSLNHLRESCEFRMVRNLLLLLLGVVVFVFSFPDKKQHNVAHNNISVLPRMKRSLCYEHVSIPHMCT